MTAFRLKIRQEGDCVMKIGIYGGTFNPPHLGHMASAQAAVELLNLDKLFFIPAAQPPHKTLPAGGADSGQRFAMTALMADVLGTQMGRGGDVEALDLELMREGPSYTADTLRLLREKYPADELWLLMGTDMFLSLPSWYKPEEIMALAQIAAFAREEEDDAALHRQAEALREEYGARVEILTLPKVLEISSTELRERLKAGNGGEEYLCPSVYGYILRRNLYGTAKDLMHLTDRELRCCSYSMVHAKRLEHIRGTEETAVRLARRWGADVEKARRAAILHDCTKYLTMEEQLQLCREYGIVLDDLEQETVKLLHAKTGAAIARAVYGQDEEIFWAIYWHTTGKADMTTLEKVIYLADYIEPTRAFDGVERLRELADRDLDEALLLGFEMSIQEMEERCRVVHPNTVKGRDWILSHRT